MGDRFSLKRLLLIVCLGFVIFIQATSAFARPGPEAGGHGGGHQSFNRGPEHVSFGHQRYSYHDGRFFWPLFFGLFEIAVNTPPIGAVVTILPSGHKTIIVGGATYYYYGNIYYRDYPGGYVVVQQPIIVQPQPIVNETITINVPNYNGGYTPVTLVKQNGGYVGPQGEYYAGNPTIDQLRVLYSK
jgi:hypothetical protein